MCPVVYWAQIGNASGRRAGGQGDGRTRLACADRSVYVSLCKPCIPHGFEYALAAAVVPADSVRPSFSTASLGRKIRVKKPALSKRMEIRIRGL